jgi:N-acyl-L-homoserine lactone synthetase
MSPPAPAAQWERTRFAWRRTVLTGSAVALLAARQALLADAAWVRASGVAAVMLVWLAGLVTAHRRVVAISRGLIPPGWAPLLVTATTVAFGILGVILFSRGQPL